MSTILQNAGTLSVCVLGLWCAAVARAADRAFIAGADISMLPEIEKLGGVYRDGDGKPADAIQILRGRGCNLFRARLFVDPDPDFDKNYGATQGLPYVVALAKRIKASGATFLLDLHYSDTWADPAKQHKPAAWKDLDFDALEKQVHDYTASVLKTLADAGVTPDMVQVGNEIAGGMIWPDGKVAGAPKEVEDRQWQRFARLFNAGAKAVREASTAAKPIQVVIHIHGGGKDGLAKWFFERFSRNPVDYDIIALSFYPAWDESLDRLKQSMSDLIKVHGKDVLIAETSYPWREMAEFKEKPTMRWEQTPAGQLKFVRDLTDAIRSAPDGRGLGLVWWYPEAIPIPGKHIWRNGAEGLFNDKGKALPALSAYGDATRE